MGIVGAEVTLLFVLGSVVATISAFAFFVLLMFYVPEVYSKFAEADRGIILGETRLQTLTSLDLDEEVADIGKRIELEKEQIRAWRKSREESKRRLVKLVALVIVSGFVAWLFVFKFGFALISGGSQMDPPAD